VGDNRELIALSEKVRNVIYTSKSWI